MKKQLPNLITCCNLLCGAMAVFLATQNAFIYAFLCVLAGAFFDFFDGMTARRLGVSGPLGIQMDSLADDITFGLAPAMMLTCYLRPAIGWWCLTAMLMAAFAAYRLAKFNIDTRQTTSFIGLATPANALFWGGIVCMPYAILNLPAMPWILLAMSLISGWLMVSEIPFFSPEIALLSWRDNRIQYLFLIGCLILIAVCILEAIRYAQPAFAAFAGTACIVWYVLINLLNRIIQRN